MKPKMSVLVSLVCLMAGFTACKTMNQSGDTGGDRPDAPSASRDAGSGSSAGSGDTGGDRPRSLDDGEAPDAGPGPR